MARTGLPDIPVLALNSGLYRFRFTLLILSIFGVNQSFHHCLNFWQYHNGRLEQRSHRCCTGSDYRPSPCGCGTGRFPVLNGQPFDFNPCQLMRRRRG